MENKYDMDAIFGNKPTTADADVDKKPKYDMDAIFGDKSDKSKALESRVKVNISEAVKQDPLAVFKSKTLSQSLGLPQDVTFRNLKEVEANAKSQEWEAAIAKSPTLKKLTADPYFAGVSFKDDALPEVEKLFREKGFAAASERRNKAIQDRKTMLNEAMSGYREDTASTLGSIGAGLAIDLPSGIVYGGGAAVFETAGEWLDRTGLIGTLLPANPLSITGEKFRELGNRAKATADALSGETNSTSPMVQGWYSGWRSFGSNAPALIGSVLTRNPKLALESLTAMVGGQEYLKAREEGKAPTESAAFATSQAFIERATEGIPLDTLFRNLRSGKGFLNTFAVNQVQEQIGEQAATVLQDLNDWAFLNPEKTFKQYLDERPSAAAQTAIATLVGSGAQTIIAQAVENTGNFLSTKQEKARFAEDNAKAMEQLFNFANTSALKGIDAKSFEQLVQASADDNAGTPSELYIDGRVFKQLADEAGVDLNTMPTIAAQLEDAINNQTDIIAPIGELTTGLANTGLESQVIENLKYEEDGLTIAESRVVFEQSKEMFKSEVDRTLATQEEKDFFEKKADEIYQNIFTQLQEVKRNTKDANDVYAELIKQFYSTEAKQQSAASGTVVTADMVFASLPAFKVVGESPITGKVYDQGTPFNQVETEEFKTWSGNAPLISSEAAATHDFKSGQAIALESYHGTKRPDRVGTTFKKSRATSGPMAYFTSSPALASSYAQNKRDTSVDYEDTEYQNWFLVKVKGYRNPVSIDRAWWSLDPEVRATVAERMKDIKLDDQAENVIYEKGGGDLGSYQWELQQTQRGWDKRGNPLKAAVESWLTSGTLFGEEEKFLEVLKLAGMPMKDVTYNDPHAEYPFVYKTYIRMNNPLVTSDVPEWVENALRDAAKKDRSRAKGGSSDMWDKNNRTLREWVDSYFSEDNAYVWTSIPDKVSDLFRSLGFDGIVDWSGKSNNGKPLIKAGVAPDGYQIIDSAQEARDDGLAVPESEVGPFYFKSLDTTSKMFETEAAAIDAANNDAINNGAIATTSEVSPVYIPFEENQIKSAIGNKGNFSEKAGLLNQDAAPIFYSALYNGIDTASVKDMPATQWKAWLAGNAAKLSIKKEEIEWTGLNEYFDLRGKDKLSKQDVLAYLANNGIKVEEVNLGVNASDNKVAYDAIVYHAEKMGYLFDGRGPDGYSYLIDEETNETIAEGYAQDIANSLDLFQDTENVTKFSDWQLDGGQNYRELLLKLPDTQIELEGWKVIRPDGVTDGTYADKLSARVRADDIGGTIAQAEVQRGVTGFKGTHWSQLNVVAHVRFNERIDADGKRVLFIEEIQSDWAQKGRKEGFGDGITIKKDANDFYRAYDRNGNTIELRVGREVYVAMTTEQAVKDALKTTYRSKGVPEGAFVKETKSWTALAVKRMMRYAADNGYDKVAFINGKQSADRYDMSRFVEYITWNPDDNSLQAVGKDDELVIDEKVDRKDLANYIGKDAAKNLLESQARSEDGAYLLSGGGLVVGGEGMKAYYDNIVPSVVNEQLKKVGGGKLVDVNMNVVDPEADKYYVELSNGKVIHFTNSLQNAYAIAQEYKDAFVKENTGENLIQKGFEVTDAMREQILKGLPLFQGGGTQALGTFDPDQFIITLKQNANLSTFLHETGHFFLEAKVKLATQDGARQQLKDDVNALMQWFGTDLGTWQRMSLEEKRASHEKFARGFEAYLFEGNAPSTELRSAFQRFSDWLKNIYVSISKLLSDNNVQLTPEVRAVMDRMLATDEQIEEAKRRRDVMALFNTKEEADMTAAEFFDYQAQLYQVTQEAKEKMAKRSLADIKYLRRAHDKYVRNFQKEGEEKRREARMEARAEVMSQPLYRAWSFLSAKDWGKVSPKEKQSKLIDPTRDSLFVAIAKLGGINRDLIISEFGLDIADIKGNPAFKAKGGMTIDGMVENLSQYGYIQTDDSGKYWLADFEDMVMDELAGSLQYSIAYNYEADQQDIVEGAQFDLAQQLPAGRLSLDEVKAIYGQNFDAVREKLGRMLASDGLMIDVVADLFKNEDGSTAFGSGKELIDAMMAALPPQLAIEDLTDKIVMERYGDITSEEAARKAADEALHNEAMLRSAATEMKAISGMQGSIRDLTRAAKDAANEAVRKIKVRDLRPSKYITAAQKAGRAADAAVKAKNPQEAAAAKRLQMINLAMVQRSYEVQAEMRNAMKAFAAVNKADKKLAKTMDINLVETARSVLASFGLNNADPRMAMENLDKVKAYNPELYAVLEPNVRAATMTARDENNNPVNYKQLTISEFFALRDTVAQLTQQAREEKKITRNGVSVELTEVNRLLTEQLLANGYKVSEVGKSIAPSEKDQRRWTVSSIKAAMRRMEHWVSMQDNNKFDGAFRSFLFQGVQDGNTQYMTVKNVKLRQYVDMLRAKEAEGNFIDAKIAATEIGYTFTGKQELLGAMLHTGNDSNKRKLLVGRNWGELVENADKKRVLDTSRWDAFINRAIQEGIITKSDYDFLQATWDLMESIKPDAQKAHYKLYGYYFDEITATAIETPFGSYRGGYAPAKADSDLVLEADIRQDINQLENDFNYMMPSTGNGFTQGRVEYNKPLVMDLRLVAQHLDQVLRFTYIQPAINDVLKIVKRGEFINTLNAVDRGALKSMIMPWLQRVATQTTSAPFQSDAGKKMAKFWQKARRNTGMNIMTANLVNALQQTTGLTMAAVKVEPKYLKSAQVRYMKAPNEVGNSISLLSDWMKIRLEDQAFDMQSQMQEIMMGTSKLDQATSYIRSHAYFMQRAMQNYVDIITWSAAYDKAISEGTLDEQDAVKYADSVVRETQSSLLPIDISTSEAGNSFTQLFTQFTNYFNMQVNLLGTNFAVNQRENGFSKKGMGKMFYIYTMGFMLPAVFADAIVRTFGWDWDDEDDDGYLDEFMAWFFGSQARTAAAMMPFVGIVAIGVLNKFNNKFYDDRITTSPTISMLDQASAAPASIYDAIFDDGSVKKAIKDSLSFAGLVSGVPFGALGRPAGYIVDWVEGDVDPENALDAIRGLVSGRGREEERQ